MHNSDASNTPPPPYPLQAVYGNQPQSTSSAPPIEETNADSKVYWINTDSRTDNKPNIVETGIVKTEIGFDDKSIRRGFIRKTFGIIVVQLLVVIGLICLLLFNNSVKIYVQGHFWLFWISIGVFFAAYIVLFCIPKIRHKVPGNYIALALLTLAMGFMTALISSYFDTQIVLMAIGMTAASCVGIIIFSIQSKYAFVTYIAVMVSLLLALVFFGIFAIIFTVLLGSIKILWLVYALIATLLVMTFLAIDVNLLMEKGTIEPEEYIFAATQIFLDLILVFIYILMLFGGGSNS